MPVIVSGRHEVRHRELRVPVPPGVQVEEERREAALQRGAGAARDREPGPRQLRRPREVEDAHGLAEVDVVLRLEAVLRRCAPAAHLDGVRLGVAVRDGVQRQVGDREEDPVELPGEPLLLGLDVPDVLLQLAGALLERGDVAALPGARAHLLRHPLGLGPELVGLADALVAAGEEVLQRRGVERVSAAREPADGVGSRVEEGAGVVHVEPIGRPIRGRTRDGQRFASRTASGAASGSAARRDYEQLVKRSRTCSRVVQGVT